MPNPLARYRAWRKEQRAKEHVILGVYDDGKRLVRARAALAFIGITDEQKRQLDGTELKCIFCGKTFVYESKHCALGFCQECS